MSTATTRVLTAPVFGLSRVLVELDASMNIKRTYVYGGDQPLKDEPVAGNHNLDLYLLSDGIVGSITDVASPNGAVSNLFQYDAFGDRIVNFASTAYSYAGQEHDAGTGLIYLRARYYDPSLGRFISADPFWGRLEEPASQNRYVYVRNNPLLYTDPIGLDFAWSEIDWDMVGQSISGIIFSGGRVVGGGALIYGGINISSTGVGALAGVGLVSAGGYQIGQGSYEVVQHAGNFFEATFGQKSDYNQDINYGAAIAPLFGFDENIGREFESTLGEVTLMLPPNNKVDVITKGLDFIKYSNDFAKSGCKTCPCP